MHRNTLYLPRLTATYILTNILHKNKFKYHILSIGKTLGTRFFEELNPEGMTYIFTEA